MHETIKRVEDGGKIAKEANQMFSSIHKNVEKVTALVVQIQNAVDNGVTRINIMNNAVMDFEQKFSESSKITTKNCELGNNLQKKTHGLNTTISKFKVDHYEECLETKHESFKKMAN